MFNSIRIIYIIGLVSFFLNETNATQNINLSNYESLNKEIELMFKDAKIPGMSMVLVENNETYYKNLGYADEKNEILVSSNTLFELGSIHMMFTSLALLKLANDSVIDLDKPVSYYIPWIRFYYKKNDVQITLKQLIYHTSGIPAQTIGGISIREVSKMQKNNTSTNYELKLKASPGAKFEFATINYDILGLIIEEKVNIPYDEYMEKFIFDQLEMRETTYGSKTNQNLAKGYKISFGKPREYDASRYLGDNSFEYIISNTNNMAKWLRYQVGVDKSLFQNLIGESHKPDYTIEPEGKSAYAFGWRIELFGGEKIYHEGNNLNFSSFIGLLPDKKIGFVLLANSNSNYTNFMGHYLLKKLNNEDIKEMQKPRNTIDNIFSAVTIIISILIIGVAILLIWNFNALVSQKKSMISFNRTNILRLLLPSIYIIPFLLGIFTLPYALYGASWRVASILGPHSFVIGCSLIVIFSLEVWLLNIKLSIKYPKSNYKITLPVIAALSIASGISNTMMILILINAIGNNNKSIYFLLYFILTFISYISCRKYIQTKLTKLSLSIVYTLRMKLINKIFSTSFQVFEKIDNGRIYTTLNQDTDKLSNSAEICISLVTNIITIICVFAYLGSISFVAAILIFLVAVSVLIIFYFVSYKINIHFELARDSLSKFSGLIDDMVKGFKELSLSKIKKESFSGEVEDACLELKDKSEIALLKFVKTFVIGESLIICVLGVVSFLIPFLFPQIPLYSLLSIMLVIIFLIGPVNTVLNAVPHIVQIKISWNRIQGFIDEIKPDLKKMNKKKSSNLNTQQDILSLSTADLIFEYKNNDANFKVGPIDLNINKGEIVFVIGGNGSGKTTLGNLLTGLYASDYGSIKVNGEEVDVFELGEKYSVIFSNNHLFKKLYGINTEDKKEEIDYLLKIMRLDSKVSVKNNEFSTIALSNGQRKRLSLLKCFLEDSQIYLFDEWAADQDPEYKKYFYRELLPKMKKMGKIVIAITHDDNYFDVADKIIKIADGKIESLKVINIIN